MAVERTGVAVGSYGWVTALRTDEDLEGRVSLSVRRRVADVIGTDAAGWAVKTGARMADYILETLSDWPGARNDEERQILRGATEASTLDTLATLVSGDDNHLSASFEPIANIGFYVRQQIPLSEVVRNVHTGQAFLTQELLGEISQLVPEDQRVQAITAMTRDVTACWSTFIGRIGEEYRRQEEEWVRSAAGERARLVREILSRTNLDAAKASRDLGYDLEQEHVCCLLWFEGLDLEAVRLFDFDSLTRELASATGSASHVAVAASAGRTELWLGHPSQTPTDTIRGGRWPAALRATVGTRQSGVAGFAATRAEAVSAAEVASRGLTGQRVVDYADVELLSLLTSDFERAKSFVHRNLGPIARQDARSQELRSTLAAWIDSSGSVATTSQVLFMHRNTVSYRLRQLQEMLGEDWDHTRLRCALLIVESMPQVLEQDV